MTKKSIIALFLVLSGIASLTYQLTWVRLLGLSFGSTSASIATVVAAFFFGMTAGSYLSRHIPHDRLRSLSPYIALELVIGISGILLLPTLQHFDLVITSFPEWAQSIPIKFFITLVLLSVPTICIGATFPVLLAILINDRSDIGKRTSELYAFNTVGAVCGALLSSFVVIPAIGLNGAIYFAVALNLIIVVVAQLNRSRFNTPQPIEGHIGSLRPRRSAPSAHGFFPLTILFLTGFVSIACEIAWTKYLGIFTGTTLHGFSIILAIFLTGVAAGSIFIKKRIARIQHPREFIIYTLLVLGLALLLSRSSLNLIPPIYEAINHISMINVLWLKAFVILLLLFPVTFLFGVLFPINVAYYCESSKHLSRDAGFAYAINTFAAIAGSIVAGFWIIPQYGTDFLLLSTAMLTLAIGALFTLTLSNFRRRAIAFGTATSIAVTAIVLPNVDYRKLVASVDYQYDEQSSAGMDPIFMHIEEGKTGVISMVTYDHRYAKLQNNGLNESVIDLEEPDRALLIESFLAYLPYFFHDNPKSAFVVGYGGGITTRAFTHLPLDSIKVVELEPAVISAVKSLPNGPAKALDDPRVTLEINDARNALLMNTQRYDIVASQPSHPWLSGTAHVFSQEFFELVKTRLNPGGIYTQWINLFHMNSTVLQSIANAFFNVFPHGMSFTNLETGDFMLIGSNYPLMYCEEQFNERMKIDAVRKTLAYHRIDSAQDLLLYFALSRDELTKNKKLVVANNDLNIFSEIQLSNLISNENDPDSPYTWIANNYHFHIAPYLDANAITPTIYLAGKQFLEKDFPLLVPKAIEALKPFDSLLSASLQHDFFTWKANYEAATRWYERKIDWNDETHLTQALIYQQSGEMDKVMHTIGKIKDERIRNLANVRLLYESKNWYALKTLQTHSGEEKIWTLAMLAKDDLLHAGNQLESIVNPKTDDVNILQILVNYYSQTNQNSLAHKYDRQIVKILDTYAERYKELIPSAFEQNDITWAKNLIQQLHLARPDDPDLARFNQQLKEYQQMAMNTQNAKL